MSYPSPLKNNDVKIRKEHICEWCNRTLLIGSIMRNCVIPVEGKLLSGYICKTCDKYVEEYDIDAEYIDNLRNEDPGRWEIIREHLENKKEK